MTELRLGTCLRMRLLLLMLSTHTLHPNIYRHNVDRCPIDSDSTMTGGDSLDPSVMVSKFGARL